MKLREFVLIFLITLVLGQFFVGVFVKTNQVDAWQPFGMQSADGSSIQIFYTEDTNCGSKSKDIRIPQDDDFLDWDYFCVFISFPQNDDNPRSLLVSLYHPEIQTFQRWDDNAQAYVNYNITTYSDLVSRTNITLYKGQNEFNYKNIALLKVTSNQITGFLPSDEESMFSIEYNELQPIEFKHRTSFDKVPITASRGDINTLILMQIAFLIISIFISVASSRYVYFRAGNIFPKFSITTLLLLVTWFIFLMFVYIYTETGSVNDTIRQFSVFRPEILSIVIAGYMFLWLPSQYRPKTLGEAILIALDIPFVSAADFKDAALKSQSTQTSSKRPRSKRKKLFSYIDTNGNKQYAKNADSYLDLISRLLFGGLKLNFEETLIIPDINGRDETIFVYNFTEKPIKFISQDQKKLVYIGVIASILITIPLAFYLWNAIILLTATLILFLIVFYAYINITTKYSYDIQGCSSNVLSAMYNVTTVQLLQNELDILLHQNMQLEREKMLAVTEAKGIWMFDWENELFADDFEFLFGKPFVEQWNKRTEEREEARQQIRKEFINSAGNPAF